MKKKKRIVLKKLHTLRVCGKSKDEAKKTAKKTAKKKAKKDSKKDSKKESKKRQQKRRAEVRELWKIKRMKNRKIVWFP